MTFDAVGGDIGKQCAGLIRTGGTLISIVGHPRRGPPTPWRSILSFVPDRAQLGQIVQRMRNGRLRTNIGNVGTFDDAITAFNPTDRINGKTIIRVRP